MSLRRPRGPNPHLGKVIPWLHGKGKNQGISKRDLGKPKKDKPKKDI
jgi:hypothetical protein